MQVVQFTLNGKRHTLSAEKAVAAMRNQIPGRIQVHAVDIEGVQFPVKQVLSQALQVPKSEFISTRAVELLRKVGLRVIDREMEPPVEVPPPDAVSISSDYTVRLSALELAIAYSTHDGKPVEVAAVINVAERFESWLAGPKK